ncbi:GntR family transcriptional regulator [Roseibium marinum]|uniref:DNA-binding GntR family transcriptional regulator n=1 Tax=Roseibium marinum TaxID=281252 RepID=A0A2S3UN50_9HYPH|nr:GntR family transcriptional regulator [Roseibium marinum]POF29114.1 DNA-binding GntR family transcriptional regulator [Roseibium marinum]
MTDIGESNFDFKVDRPAATLRHSVIESIRQAIAMGRFNAGDRMPERDLCEMTGVSRTLVREALRQLESEGLIQVIAHKGPVVATITAEQAAGIYQVREVLEGLASELFATNATDKHRRALKDAFADVREAYNSENVMKRLAAKNCFYDCLIKGSGNEALGSALYMLNSRAMILRGRSLQMPDRLKKSLEELEDILTALEARDSAKARKLAIHHVRQAAKTVMQSYQAK